MFIAVDENVSRGEVAYLAKRNFDLICARQGEMDIDFIDRALDYDVVGFLSLDSDIPSILDRRKIDLPWARSAKELIKLIRLSYSENKNMLSEHFGNEDFNEQEP